jgi:hypothetical protein
MPGWLIRRSGHHGVSVSVPESGHATLMLSPHPACLLADTTAFIQAGQPSSAAAWAACTRALAAGPVPFPAP